MTRSRFQQGHRSAQLLVQDQQSRVEFLVGGPSPQVQSVSRSVADKTTPEVATQVSRKGPTPWRCRSMHRTRPPHLGAAAGAGPPVQQPQHLGQAYLLACLAKIQQWHVLPPGSTTEKRNP